MSERIEFRIPISPTQAFYDQVRLFEFGLRRTHSAFENTSIRVSVGGDTSLEDIIASNSWSRGHEVVWERVPDSTYQRHGIHGTANWRLAQGAQDADIIVLSDADTVFLANIDSALKSLPKDKPALMGMMAHSVPPETPPLPSPYTDEYWPALLKSHNIPNASAWHQYSLGNDGNGNPLPLSPPYFNLGFIVLNRAAAEILAPHIESMEDSLLATGASAMRCQLALTLNCHLLGVDMITVAPVFNAANDQAFLQRHNISADDVKVLHYLRTDEVDRNHILDPEHHIRKDDPSLMEINRRLLSLASDCIGAEQYCEL